MLANGRRIGPHLPLGGGLRKAAGRAAEIGASTVQVFTDNPTAWRRRPTLPDELPRFRELMAAADIGPIAIHAPYLINLAGPEHRFHEQSVAVLANEIVVARAWGAAFLNVHIGSSVGDGADIGTERLIAGLVETFRRADAEGRPDDDVVVVLENGSGGGFGLGASIEELGAIADAARAAGIPDDRLGFCLDAAHLWGAGYAIDTAEGVDEVLAAFDAAIGLRRLRLVHLNDSRSEPGSRADRHEHVGAGRIGPEGLRRFLQHPGLGHVLYLLETPGMDEGYDAVNLERARALANGEQLPDLPPEAFRLRSSRGRSAPPDEEPATVDR
ncbi:MAG TPA: deoxyribonuclease IV [Candidatus Limnocylindrales bacterium]|nr:deoxyribonuclease IV [Candidatus Limnocylindrales bacterium]